MSLTTHQVKLRALGYTKRVITNAEYFVFSAMRGPDAADPGSIDAKYLTTAVVRHFAGLSPAMGPFVRTPDEAINMWNAWSPDMQRIVRDFLLSYQHVHFLSHFENAMAILDPAYLQWVQLTVLMRHDAVA